MSAPHDAPRLDATALEAFLHSDFPQVDDRGFRVELVEPMRVRVRMPHRAEHLRPGGTVSGPAIFTLADTAMYVALLAMIGPVALAVTTSTTVNFLRKPPPRDLIAEARILKLGRRLAVGEVCVFSDGEDEMVAHATLTYSIPPARG